MTPAGRPSCAHGFCWLRSAEAAADGSFVSLPEGDYVLSLAEQQLPAATPPSRSTLVGLLAGHSEIIGGADAVPRKLIAVFEREGMVRSGNLAKRAE